MQKVSPEKSKINISGYNPTISGATDKNTWQLLDDRIILRTRGVFGKIKETEIFLKDIVSVENHIVSVYIQTISGRIHTGYDIFCHTDEQKRVAIPYICNHYGELYEKELLRLKAVEDLNHQVREGKWQFPCEAFYRQCSEEKVLQLNNEFSIIKAKQIATKIIQKANADIEISNCDKYLSIEALTQFLADGKKLADRADFVKYEQQKQPRNAQPTDAEKIFLKKAEELSMLFGRDKRVAMLTDLVHKYGAKIQAMREGEQALKQLGMLYVEQQRKETSWSIMGGIAEGIAGPAAGVAVAVNTMANNARTREYNAAIRRASMDILSGAPKLAGDRYQLEEEVKDIHQKLTPALSKVTLSKPNASDIWNNMSVGTCIVNKTNSGVLMISMPVSLKKPFDLDVPEGINMVIDGTIKGEVWFDDTYVGNVFFPLPIFGIMNNSTVEITLDGMCGRSVELNGDYSIKLADNQNLWVMEA